jgi:hypothetical protein
MQKQFSSRCVEEADNLNDFMKMIRSSVDAALRADDERRQVLPLWDCFEEFRSNLEGHYCKICAG